MQNTEIEGKVEYDLKDINLESGIYDFTKPIAEYLITKKPLTDEQTNVLRTFEPKYSFEEDIRKRGREKIIEEFNEANRYFNFEEAKRAVKEGLYLTQKINPDIKIETFPIIFLFNPKYGDAKALHGQGCAININALKENNLTNDTPHQKIVSYIAHESTHIFLKQLGKKPPSFSIRKDPLKKGIYEFLWEEGLTTYVEPTHYRHHYTIIEDAEFWIKTINDWLDTNDPKAKEDLLNKCVQSPSTILWFNDMFKDREIPTFKNVSEKELDSIFLRMLTEGNGPAYHIGSYLWEKQIVKGKNLKDLVMAGSERMGEWIKEIE